MQIYLGTWQTSPSDGFWTDQRLQDSEKTLSLAVRRGIRGFDCAQSYGHGQAEQTLGKILRRFPETSFSIDTKIMPTTKDVSELVSQSTRRLGQNVDCLYLHWPRTGFDNLSFLRTMAQMKDKGLFSKVGACNLPLETLEKYISQGLGIDRIQRPLSLLWTRDWRETQSFCRERGIELAVYSPSGMGLLSGRYRIPEDLKDARKDLFCFKYSCRSQYLALLDLVSSIARAHGVSNTKVALSWTVHQDPDILVLGARTQEQLEEDLGPSITFSKTELSDLEGASRELDLASKDTGNIFSYDW